jgi:hypothetical protein
MLLYILQFHTCIIYLLLWTISYPFYWSSPTFFIDRLTVTLWMYSTICRLFYHLIIILWEYYYLLSTTLQKKYSIIHCLFYSRKNYYLLLLIVSHSYCAIVRHLFYSHYLLLLIANSIYILRTQSHGRGVPPCQPS